MPNETSVQENHTSGVERWWPSASTPRAERKKLMPSRKNHILFPDATFTGTYGGSSEGEKGAATAWYLSSRLSIPINLITALSAS